MRGTTFHNSYLLLDESQNATYDQIKMFITRMGQNSKVIINGDTKQVDIYDSGLEEIIEKLDGIPKIAYHRMGYSDIQRNDLLKLILKALEK